MAAVKKDSLLANVPSPRIIFIGGSNLSFGLNSQEIKDSLYLNPINTAINASIGIKYMLENAIRYAKEGDIMVVIPEYPHFFRDWNYGSEELFRTVFDANKSNIKLLNFEQIHNCFPYAGKFIFSKFRKYEYVDIKESDVYSVNSFNKFGDVDAHWYLENRQNEFEPSGKIDTTKYNPVVMDELKHIANKLQEKGCIMLISYPCFQESSFNNSKESIKKVEQEIQTNDFFVLGSPEKYMMPDSLMFNTPYHINKQGVELRTKLLVEDLKTALFTAKLAHDIDSLGIIK
ncbi:hypothetical protein AGMMS50262_15490 [Bacteroidia bacterium]|nr:hypothetical protein AGMMS50262_15490 [Bacteroidia bacterium]